MCTGMETALLIGGTLLSGYQAFSAGQAQKAEARIQSQVARDNAKMAERSARDAEDRGIREEAQIRIRAANMAANQRNALAAKGYSLDVGTPLDIVDNTKDLSDIDVDTAKENARREAEGFRAQGTNYQNEAALQSSRAKSNGYLFETAGTLLSGAAKSYKSYKARG